MPQAPWQGYIYTTAASRMQTAMSPPGILCQFADADGNEARLPLLLRSLRLYVWPRPLAERRMPACIQLHASEPLGRVRRRVALVRHYMAHVRVAMGLETRRKLVEEDEKPHVQQGEVADAAEAQRAVHAQVASGRQGRAVELLSELVERRCRPHQNRPRVLDRIRKQPDEKALCWRL